MPLFDLELRYATGAVDLTGSDVVDEDRLSLLGAIAPVTIDDTPGQEQWITVLPVTAPVDDAKPHQMPVRPLVQVFECDLGTSSAFSMCLEPEAALRLAQALIGAATMALCGEYTDTVQEQVSEGRANA